VPSSPDILIESLAYHGAGVGHLPDKRVVFVEDTVPGDRVRIDVIDNHERYARATIRELLVASEHRIDPLCIYHDSCGGCPWQHVTYAQQCVWKQRIVTEALRRIGAAQNPEQLVEELIKAPRSWGYRNKIELGAQTVDRNLKLGFNGRHGENFVPVDSCHLLPRSLHDVPRSITGALTYVCREVIPDLVRVNIRVSEQTHDVELSLWTKPCRISRQLVARILNDILRATSITRVIIDGTIKERNVKQIEVLAGRGYWREMLDGRYMKLSAPSFYQVNSPGAQILVESVLELLERASLGKLDRVLDLYAGAGTFTLPLAARYHNVCAVESYGPSIRDLRRNLSDNNLEAKVVGGDVARELAGLGAFEAVVIDPPRSGLSPQACSALISAQPRAIVYVSCDPTTLARDIRTFTNNGYQLVAVYPVDLFPQTYHVECVSLLTRTQRKETIVVKKPPNRATLAQPTTSQQRSKYAKLPR